MSTDWNELGTPDVMDDLRNLRRAFYDAKSWGKPASGGVRLTPEAAAHLKDAAGVPSDATIETLYGLPVTIDLPSGHEPRMVVW